jgi:hypothetical protein
VSGLSSLHVHYLTIIKVIYFKNIFNTAYLPINSSRLFANNGKSYKSVQLLP